MERVWEWTGRTGDGESVGVNREDKGSRECGSGQGGQGMEGVWEWRECGSGQGGQGMERVWE